MSRSLIREPYEEPDTLAWIDAMPEGACLWDIGANIGVYSLYAAATGVSVVAFEPAAANFAALNANVERNGAADRIAAYCVAFAGETKLGRLNMAEKGRGSAAGSFFNAFETEIHVAEESGGDRYLRTLFRQGAVGFGIDEFAERFDPPLPTHVKLDVDNIEADILRGGRRVLSAASVRSMLVEMQGDLDSDRNRELFALMAELGFVARPKQSPELRNVIFERPAAD